MNTIKLLAAAALAVFTAMGATSGTTSERTKMDKFIDRLMSKMTIEEKIGQLNLPVASGNIVTGSARNSDIAGKIRKGNVGGLFNVKGAEQIREIQRIAVEDSRLKIPLIFGMDVIHGYETVYPIPLALSCSWDVPAIERSARVAAEEASADGICWTFSPMVDIARDPRWGRVAEGSGEDPFLGSKIAAAMIRGYQGDGTYKQKDQIMACVKHFALYGAAEAGRDYNTVDMSRLKMYNEYLPPYKAAVEAGVGSVMTSFNTIDGIPASGNKWLLSDLLRKQWGFNGFVVTDYTAIYEMIAHGLGNLQEVSALALKAGTDMDMVSEGFVGTLAKSFKEGKVTEKEIDTACRRILEAKYVLGLFDGPYRFCNPKSRAKEIYAAEHRADARSLAAKTFVLLKNEGNLLPLRKQGKIALIGPLANTNTNLPGTWSPTATFDRYRTLLEGFRAAVGNKGEVLYAKGSNIVYDAKMEANIAQGRSIRDNRTDKELLDEAVAVAEKSDVIVAALGELAEMSGESSSRSDLRLPAPQAELLKALLATGKPVILLNFAGRPTVLSWEEEYVPAIMNVWFGGSEAADAIADVVFGDVAPSGKLTMSFPRSEGQIPLYYAALNTGRPLPEGKWFQKFTSNYLDIPNTPLYPFGYGLSYTTFSYGNFSLSSDSMDQNGSITASVTVTNTGAYDADEVVQLYIRDLVGSISRPVKELKGFERISLKKGESKVVTFTINADLLKFYNSNLDYVCEPGEFNVMVGPNSRDLLPAKKFILR